MSTPDKPAFDPDQLAEIALDLYAEPSTTSTVERIADYARDALRADDAGVMLVHSRTSFETAAATSERVATAHALQIEFDEGPCLDSITDSTGIYLVHDAASETRWPGWSKLVADLGFRSILGVRLETRAQRFGSLNLYSTLSHAFDADDVAVTSIFARHASIVLAASRTEEGMQRAMDARKVIGIAMGLLMERYSIDAERAFDVLRRYSQANNTKLRDVARLVADRRELPR